MEEDFSDKLRKVFDVCDEQNEGYITIDHFKSLAKEHFGADEKIVGIIQILDPDGKGKISFEDFQSGVQQILDMSVPVSPSPSTSSKDAYSTGTFKNFVSEDLLVDLSSNDCQQESSKGSAYTYNEYDTNTDEECLIDLSPPDIHTTQSLSPSVHNGRHDYTDEESYEDYGEIDDTETDTSDHSHHNKHDDKGYRVRTRRGDEHHRSSGSCDSGYKAPSRRGDKHHRRSSGPRKITSAAVYASQLQRQARSETPPEIYDDIDGNFQTLNNRVQFLERQLSKNNKENHTVEATRRLKDENSYLLESIVDRIHSLEDQLRDVEVNAAEKVAGEQKRVEDMLSRMERDKSEQMYVAQRLQDIEKDYERLKRENPKLREEVDRLRLDKLELQDKLTESQADYNALYSENEELKLKFEKERFSTGQLLDELGKELGDLRQYKITNELHRPRSNSQADLPGRYQALNTEVNRLKEENKELQSLNEDLNAQLLTRCINEGKNLVGVDKDNSLASELEHLTKEELMRTVQEHESVISNLKQYVNKIILTILEKNPSILEITAR